ncbi:MAG: hypothetical protein HOD39_03220 [Verrucomicrobia bacterium]|nr:hypothetical protein [Verrucomicrobiota bacterium]MBT6236858.1 hypothetical protein [Verrucomicrobiota bacterium]MBT7537405.1 hypothetical protein [Verrucomicrobiota bacterium]MDB4651538.1 hypothetical protein [Verrucomicrobiota bacterium]
MARAHTPTAVLAHDAKRECHARWRLEADFYHTLTTTTLRSGQRFRRAH